MCFSEAVVDALFRHKRGLASYRVHPLKLTKKHILPSKHALVVVEGNSSTVRSQNEECCQSGKKCKEV